MKIIQRIFRRKNKDAFWESSDRSTYICHFGLGKLFNIPAGAKRIWLTLHDTAEPEREPLRIRWSDDRPKCFWRNNQDGYARLMFDEALTPYIGKTVYLECWYK